MGGKGIKPTSFLLGKRLKRSKREPLGHGIRRQRSFYQVQTGTTAMVPQESESEWRKPKKRVTWGNGKGYRGGGSEKRVQRTKLKKEIKSCTNHGREGVATQVLEKG